MNTVNKEYKRLTKKGGYTKELDLKQELGYSYIYTRLSELEDKIENGTLVELPCKVGDTVYYDTYLCGKNVGIKPHKVSAVRIMVDAEKLYVGSVGAEIPEWEFGKSVFYTCEEAEAKLKELQEKEE